MELKENIPCAVWNQDDEVWVLPTANDMQLGTLDTIADLADKRGTPIRVRYPGNVETVESVH